MTGPLDWARANQLLEELRADPTGWPSLDVANLLSLWDFREERLVEGRWEAVLWMHRAHPDLHVVLSPSDRVHVAVTLHVVRIIDTLKQRLGLP